MAERLRVSDTLHIGTRQKMPTHFGPIYLGYRPVQGYLLINYFRDAYTISIYLTNPLGLSFFVPW